MSVKQARTTLKNAVFQADPSRASYIEQQDQTEILEKIDEKLGKPLKVEESEPMKKEKQRVAGVADFIQNFLQTIKGEKGDNPTAEELIALIKPLIPDPIPGKDGKDGKNGQDGKDGAVGKTGPMGNMGPQGKQGPSGPPGKDGKKGEDGKPVTVQEVIDEIKKTRAIDISHIKNGEQLASAAAKMNKIDTSDLRWHGGGTSLQHFVAGEIVAGSGTSWTLAKTPKLFLGLYGNGQRLSTAQNDYTIDGRNITTTNPWDTGTLQADYYS